MTDFPRQIGSDIEVTDAMADAGGKLLYQNDLPPPKEDLHVFMKMIYRVMDLARQKRWTEVEALLRTDHEYR